MCVSRVIVEGRNGTIKGSCGMDRIACRPDEAQKTSAACAVLAQETGRIIEANRGSREEEPHPCTLMQLYPPGRGGDQNSKKLSTGDPSTGASWRCFRVLGGEVFHSPPGDPPPPGYGGSFTF